MIGSLCAECQNEVCFFASGQPLIVYSILVPYIVLNVSTQHMVNWIANHRHILHSKMALIIAQVWLVFLGLQNCFIIPPRS